MHLPHPLLCLRLEKLPEVRAVIQTLSQPISSVPHVQQFCHAIAWSQGNTWEVEAHSLIPAPLLLSFVFSLCLLSPTPNQNSLELGTTQIFIHTNTTPLLQLTSLMASKMTNPL